MLLHLTNADCRDIKRGTQANSTWQQDPEVNNRTQKDENVGEGEVFTARSFTGFTVQLT